MRTERRVVSGGERIDRAAAELDVVTSELMAAVARQDPKKLRKTNQHRQIYRGCPFECKQDSYAISGLSTCTAVEIDFSMAAKETISSLAVRKASDEKLDESLGTRLQN